MRAGVAPSTGFVAERGTLGALLVADASEDGARLLGASAMRFDAAGAMLDQQPIPWLLPAAAPRLGRTADGRWIAAYAETAGPGASRVGLWRGGAAEIVGQGDGFEPVDLWCEEGRCALLTRRLGRVAMAGAEAWIGAADAPVPAWRRVVIEPPEGDSESHPLGIARLEVPRDEAPRAGDAGADGSPPPAPPRVELVVAVADKAEVKLFQLDGEAAREIGRLLAPHGALDVLGIPEPTGLLHGTPVDEEGCVPAGTPDAQAKLRFARGDDTAEVPAPAPPIRGALRRLGRGALATWITPLGCRMPRRIVYAVRLDEGGKPAGAVIPVADADRYAVASAGDDVDLWLQQGDSVLWVRLGCSGAP
jgi:hypothetical protein